MPLVSVVIPLYNKQRFISRAIDSVLSQDFEDFEVVVVDDGSTDSSVSIVEKYTDRRIRIIKKANGGVSSARNSGLRAALGEFVAFLDADDQWFSNHLSVLLLGFDLCEDAVAVCDDYERLEGDVYKKISNGLLGFEKESVDDYKYYSFDVVDALSLDVFVPHSSSTMVKLNEVKGVEFNERESLGEDVNYWIRVGLLGSFYYASYPGCVYHKDDNFGVMNKPREISRPMPDYLAGISVNSLSRKEVADIDVFLRSEFMKSAFQNRGLKFRSEEIYVSYRFRFYYAFLIFYFVVRFFPSRGFGLLRKVKKMLAGYKGARK